jgi:hypothetical protein
MFWLLAFLFLLQFDSKQLEGPDEREAVMAVRPLEPGVYGRSLQHALQANKKPNNCRRACQLYEKQWSRWERYP